MGLLPKIELSPQQRKIKNKKAFVRELAAERARKTFENFTKENPV
jgi:hypothetical protein